MTNVSLSPTRNRPSARPPRNTLWTLLLPREHGLWSMLIIAIVLPAVVLRTGGAAWSFAAAATVLFFARRPLEIWLQGGAAGVSTTQARTVTLLLSVPGALLGVLGLMQSAHWLTIVLAAAIGVLVGYSVYVESQPRRGRGKVASRIAGTVGMSALILLQESASFGHISAAGASLLLLYLAFYTMSGVRVRSLVRARNVENFRGTAFFVNVFVFLGVAVAALFAVFPPLAPVALASGLFQAFRILRRDDSPVNTMRMGIGEILHSITFVVIVVLAYR